jgi:hypothetical protein
MSLVEKLGDSSRILESDGRLLRGLDDISEVVSNYVRNLLPKGEDLELSRDAFNKLHLKAYLGSDMHNKRERDMRYN